MDRACTPKERQVIQVCAIGSSMLCLIPNLHKSCLRYKIDAACRLFSEEIQQCLIVTSSNIRDGVKAEK